MRDAIQKIVNDNPYTGSGVSCTFWKLPDGRGLKTYYSVELRDHNYKLQKFASLHGLAPKCYERLNITRTYHWGNAVDLSCYITECVETTLSAAGHYGRLSYSHTKFHEVWQALVDIGIIVGDDHEGNFGLLRGRCVCIDFGQPDRHVKYRGSPVDIEEKDKRSAYGRATKPIQLKERKCQIV